MISGCKQSDSCITNLSFDVGLFVVEDDLKDQAKKILEEAAEVYSAWENLDNYDGSDDINNDRLYCEVVKECADVIQASMNMMYAIGCSGVDIEHAMNRCLRRNKERGRC